MGFKNKKYRRKRRNKKRKGRKKYYDQGKLMYLSSGLNTPMPQRLRTKFHVSMNGVNALGGTAQRLYNVKFNSIHTPFNVTTSGTSIALEGPFIALANIKPTGYTSLVNANLYTQYRVFGSKIKMQFHPEGTQDVVYVAITPSTTISSPANYSLAITQPYTRQGVFSCYKNFGPKNSEWVSNYCSVARLMGVNQRAVEDDVSTVYNAVYNADPSDIMYWVINWCQTDNVVPAAICGYTIEVTYYVELFGLATASMLET